MALIEVCVPALPDCWDTRGNCSDGEITVVEWLVRPGDSVRRFDPVVVVEAEKTTLEIPSPRNGRITEHCVQPGDTVTEGSLLLRLESS